jgi:hypothetical protein
MLKTHGRLASKSAAEVLTVLRLIRARALVVEADVGRVLELLQRLLDLRDARGLRR